MTAEQALRARKRRAQAALQVDEHGGEAHEGAGPDPQLADANHVPVVEPRSAKVGIALGVFSIGLGIAEIVAPRMLARAIGLRPNAFVASAFRLYGVREVAVGIGMVLQPTHPGWAWARVGEDLLDLATLVRVGRSGRINRGRLAVATAAVVGATALDLARARQLGPRIKPRLKRHSGADSINPVQIRQSITINRQLNDVYEFWRDFANLPRFMEHLDSVTVEADGTSSWNAVTASGGTVSWIVSVVDDVPNDRIAWHSLQGSEIRNAGAVEFTASEDGLGTVVSVNLLYVPPQGDPDQPTTNIFGDDPELRVTQDLERLQQVLESESRQPAPL